jgi:glutamyl/glutaminyl-tRNA synthetase
MGEVETNHSEKPTGLASEILAEATRLLQRAGFLSVEIPPEARAWLEGLVAAYLPDPENVAEFPERVRTVFHYDAAAALARVDTQEVFARETARPVVRAFAHGVLSSPSLDEASFEEMLVAIRARTHCTGRDLMLPIRIVLTGQFRGPELKKIPLLIEEGSRLALTTRIKSCRERIIEFCAALG